MLVIVPNELSEAIYQKVDAQLELVPQLKDQRENIYSDLLAYFDEHGTIPDFTIAPQRSPDRGGE
jgi:hypothetical protein